jgi:hypothetical protein
MYRQFNIQQFYVLPTQLYLCVLCGSQNKQRLFPYTALTGWFFITETQCVYCAVRTGYFYIQYVLNPAVDVPTVSLIRTPVIKHNVTKRTTTQMWPCSSVSRPQTQHKGLSQYQLRWVEAVGQPRTKIFRCFNRPNPSAKLQFFTS